MAKVAPVKGVRGRNISSPRTFLDTNIFLYCDEPANRRKRGVALDLVLTHLTNSSGVVSLQVLQEYFANATRKLKMESGLARQKVEIYSRFEVVEPSIADVLAAVDLHRLHQLSFWDALVLHCARKSGCSILLTEDMQHGQTIDGVRIINPFI